ncbi:MAG: hypothetical protein ACHQAY_14740 [Hyphomicrobiales bacterium]
MISRLLGRLRNRRSPPVAAMPVANLDTSDAAPKPAKWATPASQRAAKPVEPHFSIEDYLLLLEALRSRGVRFETLHAPDQATARTERLHFIKHDMHHDLENTLLMAKAEHEIGVHSTFFMMHENPINRKYFHAPSTWDGLRRIQDMGHLIGLHVDGFLLIEQYGDLARGIDAARKTFAEQGISFKIGNTHGNSSYQKKYDFEPMNFYKEVRRPSNSTEKRFMDHYGRYSFHDLGFDVWADTAIWTPAGGEWLLDYFVSDNASNLAAGESAESSWFIDGAKWDLSEEVRRQLADYVSRGCCIYLIHPQFFRPRSAVAG